MTITLKRLEQLRDKSFHHLQVQRTVVERLERQYKTFTICLRVQVGFWVLSALGLISGTLIPILIVTLCLMVTQYTRRLCGNDVINHREIRNEKLDTFTQRQQYVTERQLIHLMNPEEAHALEHEGEQLETQATVLFAKRYGDDGGAWLRARALELNLLQPQLPEFKMTVDYHKDIND